MKILYKINFKTITNIGKTLFFSFLILFSCLSFGNENKKLDLNIKILNKKDIKLYNQIFDFQSKGIKSRNSKTWTKINKLKKSISNKLLFGTIEAEKYLHPTGWRSSYTELKKWLDNYNDHPDAYRIYRLAKRRKPKKLKFPKKPVGNFLNGYGNILKDQLKPTFPLVSKGHKYPKYSFQTAIKVRRGIRKTNTKYVENLLISKKTKKYLTDLEMSQLRAELANAYFIFKKDQESIRQSRISINLSDSQNALAFWSGGLAAWRFGDYKLSKWFFNNLSELTSGPESILSGGSCWAAKLAYHMGETKEINKYLKRAANYERTFYSTLAKASLGYKEDFNFNLEPINEKFINKLKSLPGGKRILALLQVSQYHKASREFRKIIFNFKIDEYSQIVSFAANYNMPGLAFRISALLRNDYGKILLGGLYPIPKWKTDRFKIKDNALLYSISRQESGFNPRAKSYANALGVMQVLPSTAAFIMNDKFYRYRAKKHLLYNLNNNLKIGAKYIDFLLGLDLINNNVLKMLASYNAGPGNFKKWTKKAHYKEKDPLLMIESLPARQTRNYIKLVLTNLWIYRSRLNEVPYIIPALASGENTNLKMRRR